MRQIRVLLVGGPDGLSEADRIREVDVLADKISLSRGNGYEHFRHSGDFHNLNGSPVPVYQWCYATKIAE
ncbi:MAG TPA: DUF5988 family protein [Actinophytocola sp.]|uniref:DUF5988 family protein n=1 Tax=Actinophytocola sp. TaxID=1872138 RepID=UPI002DB6E592|nr:DUF5988 family protein [Actinophytocola sp.]HEU5470751.1 DUF5988 family protein [Actinophytocola sp.]